VLVSLRAQTARQAAQTMSLFILALIFIPVFGLQMLPVTTRAELINLLSTTGTGGLLLIVLVLLVALDGVLLALAMARFQRAKLILD
jgi:hypothetical protein